MKEIFAELANFYSAFTVHRCSETFYSQKPKFRKMILSTFRNFDSAFLYLFFDE